MQGRWVGVLSLIALTATALSVSNNAQGPQTLAMLPQSMVADAQTAVVGNGSASASTAADAQCPKASSENKSGYYPDKPWNADFKDQGYTYHNLYGKPCQGSFVKAFCRKENFCDGTMAGSQCESNGVWGACKEQPAGTVKVACTTPAACAMSNAGNPPADGTATAPKDTATPTAPTPNSAANTQPSVQPTTPTTPTAPTTPSTQSAAPASGSADTGIKAIAGSGAPTTAAGSATQSLGTGAGSAAGSSAPVTPAPTGPAFQSTPSYLSGGSAPSGGAPTTGTTPGVTTPTESYNRPVSSAWSPGYSSASYSGGSSPVAAATNQSNSNVFSSILSLFGGLFGGGGSSGGSSVSVSASAPAQKTSVQNIIQLFVEVPPTNGTVIQTATIPAPVQSGSNPLAYNIVILGTPPVALDGTSPNSLAEDNFKKLLALAGTPPSENSTTGQTSFAGSAQGGISAPSVPSPSVDTLPHADALNSTLASTSVPAVAYVPGTQPVVFSQPYAVSATAPAGTNGFSATLSLIDNYAGGWTGGKVKDPAQALLANRAALAQVQSDYENTQAALAAWQSLADAGLCPESCQTTIAALQGQLPGQQKQMKKLSDAVYQEATTLSHTPVIDSGITGLARDPQRAAELLINAISQPQNLYYGDASQLGGPTDASGTPIRTVAQYDLSVQNVSSTGSGTSLVASEIQSGNSSTGLPELLSHLWTVLTGWFAPSASSTPSGPGCSLLGSLFGFCKNK